MIWKGCNKIVIIKHHFLFNHELPHLSGHAVMMRERREFRQIPNDKQRVVIAYKMTGMSDWFLACHVVSRSLSHNRISLYKYFDDYDEENIVNYFIKILFCRYIFIFRILYYPWIMNNNILTLCWVHPMKRYPSIMFNGITHEIM